MSRKETYINADGLTLFSGGQISSPKELAAVHTKGKTKEVIMIVEAGNLQSVGTAVHGSNESIPAGAFITSACLNTKVAFNGNLEVGTMTSIGTAIDSNGLIVADISGSIAINTKTVGGGVQINTSIGQEAYVAVTPGTVTPTVGSGELIVTYQL